MLYRRTRGIVIFVLLSVLFMGCDRIFYKTVDIRIEAVDIVSISEDRPAEVLFVVAGIMGDGCDPSIQKVSAERMGNTIVLGATGSEEIFDSGGYACTMAVEATGGTIVVKTLGVGKYTVVTHDGREHLQFRIEQESAYVVRKAGIGDIVVQLKTAEGIVIDTIESPYRASFFVRKAGSEDIVVQLKTAEGSEGIVIEYPHVDVYTAEPVQVSIGVEGYLRGYACEYPPKIVIDKGSSGIMNVKIFSEVPINADCTAYEHLDEVADEFKPDYLATKILFGSGSSNRFETQIYLGTFGTGAYRVNINGYDEVGFSIYGGIER